MRPDGGLTSLVNQFPEMMDLEAPNIPKDLLGPTGKVFLRSDGNYSTELNTTLENGGRYYNAPLLIPGQSGLQSLIGGGRPTDENVSNVLSWISQQGPDYPSHGTLDEALAAQRRHHDQAEQGLAPYIAPYLSQWLDALSGGGGVPR